MKDFSKQEIEHMFDTHPNLTLSQLAIITGLSVKKIKKILMDK